MFKLLTYIILLLIHVFGSTIATLGGIVCIAIAFVGACESEYTMALLGLIATILCLGLQRFFISLDPSWIYDEEYDD